jgi:hypothetical protein
MKMKFRNKARLKSLAALNTSATRDGYGFMRGSVIELGDIISPAWDGSPMNAELGIAYFGQDGPVYYTGKGSETTDGL